MARPLLTAANDSDYWLAYAAHDHDHSHHHYAWLHDHDRVHADKHHHDHDYGDTIFGDDGDDIIFGQQGHDVLRGGAGDDWLIGGADKDDVDGGSGSGKDRYHQGENDSHKLHLLINNRTPLIDWSGVSGSFFDATDMPLVKEHNSDDHDDKPVKSEGKTIESDNKSSKKGKS